MTPHPIHIPARSAPPESRPVFVVVERDALISTDLIQAIESRGPCRVMHFASAAEAGPAIDAAGPIRAAFLAMRVDELADSALPVALARHGARMVLTLGEDVERAVERGWVLLVRPFTERMVHEALTGV